MCSIGSSLAQSNESLAALLKQCAPNVHPLTMGSIVSAESGGNIYALLDNDRADLPLSQRKLRSYKPQSKQEAIDLAEKLIRAGHTVDMGLAQINNRNLGRLRMTVADAFDPCKNVWAGQEVLSNFYRQAAQRYGAGSQAVLHALSGYNTGSLTAGLNNGYVDRVLGKAKLPLPGLHVGAAYASGYKELGGHSSGHGVMTGQAMSKRAAKLASADVSGWE